MAFWREHPSIGPPGRKKPRPKVIFAPTTAVMKTELLALALSLAASISRAPTQASVQSAPCPYGYPAASRPACVGGHTNRLLPIVYGRPTPQTRRRARQGQVVLRGCLVSGCDPRYYCPVHKKDL